MYLEVIMMDMGLLSPCNVYCANCVIYKKSKCSGCKIESERRESEGKVFCDIFLCARDRRLVTCSDCASYPCEKHDKGIFAESYIGWVREKLSEQ